MSCWSTEECALCISLRLPREVEGVENLLISERGSSDISRNPAQGDGDAADYVMAGAATARKGIDGKTKRRDDVVSEAIKFPNLSNLWVYSHKLSCYSFYKNFEITT
jgi:hypothetical protein